MPPKPPLLMHTTCGRPAGGAHDLRHQRVDVSATTAASPSGASASRALQP
jgi:hypothetical protein